jgi:GGDEF domain-containing protein
MRFAETPEIEADAETRVAQLSSDLGASLRKIDARYRTGDNEFAVILPETRADGAVLAARRVQAALLQSDVGEIIGGIAEAGPGLAPNILFRHAYSALLAATREPQPGFVCYSPELEASVRGAADLRA